MTRVSQLFSLLGFAAFLGGCPIYIDDTGSSDCVGLDCPFHECEGNDECLSNEVCEDFECVPMPVDECRVDGDCAPDERCTGNQCVPSDTCGQDSDCSGGLVCDYRGTCVDAGGCRTTADCTSGEVCLQGTCTPPSNTCQFNYQCGAGRACVNNACVNTCSENSNCPSGQACVSSFCQDTTECDASTDCDSGELCVRGQCLEDCRAGGAAACGEDEKCGTDGFCHPDAEPRPFCTSNAQCAADHVCRDGVCRTPCPTTENSECQSFDVQLPTCAMASGTEEYLCYAPNERNPECALPTDCNEGQACIDAICRNR